MIRVCDDCLRRAALLDRLSGHLDNARSRVLDTLALSDHDLIAAVGGARRAEVERWHRSFDARVERVRCEAAGVAAVCRCQDRWPAQLRDLAAEPAVLFIRGDPGLLERTVDPAAGAVAVVGARRATEYGHEVAGALGRGLGSAGVTVVSGMAIGIDAAAHTGTLDAGGTGIAVVPSSVDRPYPADARRLARAIGRTGAVVSELPPAVSARRWMFPARNRIIAALAAMTVVVEAAGRSGSLVTARVARDLGRIVGAVPGRVTTSQAEGPNALISQGATVVRSTIDVLEALYGGGGGIELPVRAPPPPEQRELLAAIAGGADTESGLAAAGFRLREVLAGVAALELSGHVRRGGGGRFVVIP